MNIVSAIIDREIARYDEATRWAKGYIDCFGDDHAGSFDDLVESFYANILAMEDAA